MNTVLLDNPISKNPLLMNLNKFQKDDGFKITIAKEVLELAMDEENVESSDQIIKFLNEYKKALPDDFGGDIKGVKIFLQSQQTIFSSIDDFLNFVSDFYIDDKHAKKLVKNLNEAKKIIRFIIGYLQLVVDTHYSIEDIKKSKKVYTFSKLQTLLSSN